ncbi:unnamed protein product, partial [Mesorhabditis spiculigera]
MSSDEPTTEVEPTVDIEPCKDYSYADQDLAPIITSIWNYISSYQLGHRHNVIYKKEVMCHIFEQAKKLIAMEPTVLDLRGPITVIGPLHGEGDALIALMSMVGPPTDHQYLFLGNFAGLGYASLEVIFMLLCMKLKYPGQIHILKGFHEDPAMFKEIDLYENMQRRGLFPEELRNANDFMEIDLLSRPPTADLDLNLTVEAMWARLELVGAAAAHDLETDMPRFTDVEATQFCQKNQLELLVRGRQLVDGGFLNHPNEVVTLVSATAHLDCFRNHGAALGFGQDTSQVTVMRYACADAEPGSLDEHKPSGGRNSVPI